MKAGAGDRLMLLGAAALFSTGGAAIKAASVTPWQVASFRSGVAAVTFLLLMPAARRGWSWKLLPVALAYAGTLVLFVLATRLTTSANAIFLQSTAPLYLLLLAPLLLHEKIRRSDLWFIAAVAAGMALVLLATEHASAATAPDPALGNKVAAGAGLAWALTMAGFRWLGRSGAENEAVPAVAAGNIAAFLIALPMALPIAHMGAADVAVLLYLGVVQIGLAYFLVTRAIRRVPAFEATALLLLEPALNPVWTWIVHHERPSTGAIAGGAIILAATLVQSVRAGRVAE